MDSCGLWVDEFDGSSIAPGCNRNCKAEIVKQGRTEWWVQIRTREARTPRQIHGDFSKPFFQQPQPIGLNAIKNKYANHSAWKRHRRKPKSASPGLDWPLGTEEHEHTALKGDQNVDHAGTCVSISSVRHNYIDLAIGIDVIRHYAREKGRTLGVGLCGRGILH